MFAAEKYYEKQIKQSQIWYASISIWNIFQHEVINRNWKTKTNIKNKYTSPKRRDGAMHRVSQQYHMSWEIGPSLCFQ